MTEPTAAGQPQRRVLLRGPVLAWALYDWANSAFAAVVLAGFFPVFFKTWWNAGVAADVSTARLGAAIVTTSAFVAVAAPVLGAIGDGLGGRKRMLALFAAVGILATATLYAVPEGAWLAAACIYALATACFALANVFNDSLLADVCEQAGTRSRALVSGYGYALGYLGGGLLLLVSVLMTLHPAAFGVPDAATAVRLSFLAVALWWGLFSLPLLLVVHEGRSAHPSGGIAQAVRRGLGDLRATWHELRVIPGAGLFLLSYWLYIDGVYTVIRMAVDYGLALGFDAGNLITALLITQFIGFPATLILGVVADRVGPRRVILAGLLVYTLSTLWAAGFTTVGEFYGVAAVIGLAQGTVQAASRAVYSRYVPAGAEGRFFGLFGAVGRFAAVLGPALVTATVWLSGNNRAGVAVVAILFVIGGALLARTPETDQSQTSISRASG